MDYTVFKCSGKLFAVVRLASNSMECVHRHASTTIFRHWIALDRVWSTNDMRRIFVALLSPHHGESKRHVVPMCARQKKEKSNRGGEGGEGEASTSKTN